MRKRRRYQRVDIGGIDAHFDHGSNKPDDILEIEIPAIDRTIYRAVGQARHSITEAIYSYSERPLE